MRHSRSKPIGWAFFLLAVQLASSATGRPEEPPAPEPSPAVRQLLDRTEELLKERKAAEVLVLADQALAEADTAQDAAGRALAHAARARALQALERPGEAVAAWRDAEVTWEEAGDVPGRIDALCSQAILLAVQEPDEAARSLNRVLALARQATERPLALIASLNRAGRRLTRVDRLADAKSLSEAALELGEVHAPGSLEVAASLDNLGNVAWFQGDLTTARNRHVRALELREKHSAGSTDVATSLNNLGNVVREQGDLAAARDLYVRALEIKEKQAPGSLDLAASLNNLGIVARMQGDFTTARDYHLRAFEINEKQAPASLSVADSLNLLGNLARAQGDLPTARDYLLRALEIREKRVPGSRYVAESFANLGAVAGLQGDLAAARDFFLRALDFYEDHSPGSLEVALSLNDLGAVAGLQGDLAAARDYFLRALKIQEEHAPGSLDVATSLNNLGTLTRDEGDFATAWDLHLRALEINEKHAPSSLGVAESLSNLGTVAREQGDLAAARDYYLRALKIQEEHAPGSLDVAASLNKLGNVAFKLGEFDSARDSLEEAWRIVRRQAGAVTGDEARRAFEATHADYATDVIRSKLALGRSAEALETLEQGRARALLQMLALRGLPALLSEEALAPFYKARHALEQAQAELDGAGTAEGQAQAELKQLRAGRVPTDDVTEKERELAAATASRKERAGECTRLRVVMEQELANVRRLLPGGLGEDSLPLDQARRSLPEQALFVAFSVGEDETSVFLVPADHEAAVTAYTVQVRSDDLARRVEAIVEHTRSHKASRPAMLENERLLAARGRELYATLFPREVQPLLDSAQRLLISPDGPLWELPLAALALPGSGDEVRWLGLEKPLAYAHSLSVYAREKARPQSAATASVIVGDPIYSRTKQPGELVARVASAMRGERSYLYADGRPPDQLPWTGEEARQIGRLYGTSPLVGDDATERAVREQIGAARLVHLATHGYFHPEMPMSSGVLLSLPDSDDAPRAADGTLQAWEFASQIRMDADLLVLSACETGRGRLVPGEGLIGLTRAVQIAGARSVVATHWRIDDSSAAQIMVAFHEALRGGAAKDDALRLAMRDVQASNPTREPYYWAGFLLVGDIGAAAGAAATEQPRDPPGPEPSPAVRQLLDRAEGMLGDRKAAEVLALADQALALADQALAAADTIEDVAGRALAHAARARSFETLERPGEAVAAWRDAEVAWEEAGDVPGRIDALCSQAILLGGQEPDQAARLLDRALATARQESKRPLAAIASLNRGGDALAKAGRLNEAKSLSEAALALGEARAPGSLDVARSLNGLGNVAYREGDLVVARDFYLRALEIQEKRAPGSLDVARCLNGLGNVAWSEGDLVAAVDFYLRALEIREKHAPSLDVAASFNNLGTVAGDQGDLVAARDYHLRALAIREKHAPGSLDVAMSLNNLGTVAHDQGDLVAARDYYQRALAIEERHAPGSLAVAGSLNNLGAVADDQGDLVAARDYHLRALAIREKHAPDSLDVAASLDNLGVVARNRGDLVAARDDYLRALAIREKHAPGSLDVASSLNHLGTVAFKLGDVDSARDSLERAWGIVRRQAGLVTGDEARRAFEARHAEHAIDLIRAQLALGRSAEALETLEQGRAQALLQMVALRGLPELLSAEALAPYHKARHELEQAQAGLDEAGAAEGKADAALKALRGVSDPTDELAQREQELATARAAREEQTRVYTRLRVEMEEELARVRSLLPGGVGEEPLPLEQSRRALAAGALFVAFSVGEEDTAVFFVPADSEAQLLSYTVPIGSDELSRRVQSIVALAGTHRAARPAMLDSERRLAAEGRELYAALFSAEAAQALLESARQLLISPDGPLWELPFAALALPGGGDPVRWLGLEKPLAYEHSLSVHAREKARPRAAVTTASVIVGDPTYSRETAPGASAEAASAVRGERSYLYADGKPPARLPWTGEEARQIGRLYGTSPLVGGAATEGAVRERIDEAGLVHLATHGYFHPEMPMSSGVLLAVPEPDAVTTDADGMLQAWEFASQIHMNSDLVVLSACETGRGGRVQGEGLVGLTRAVRIAGARSIVATHWKIDDESAKEIMLAFHEALRGGAAKDEALRQAMRKAQAQSATRAPYYWAGFLLVGDVEARPQS